VRIVLLGPPGVGKGTQGQRLAAEGGWPLISTGEMLREAAARGTPLGRTAKQLIEAGLLVPDDVMIGLVRERTALPDALEGFVLDGFPRTVPQAEALDQMLEERGQKLDAIVSLTAPEQELMNRLRERRRVDDSEDTVRMRLQVYRERTAPLIEHYRRLGRLREVNGVGSLDDVFRSLKSAIGREAAA
jgi:adenylate kinase